MSADQLSRRQTIHLRHIDVHDDDLGIKRTYTSDSFGTITGLAYDINARDGFHQTTNALPNHAVIIDQ